MDALCGAECSAELARQAAAGAQALAEASAPALESAVKAAPAVAGSAAQVAGTAAQGLFKLGWKSVEIAGPVVVESTKAALPVVSEATRAALPAAQRALEDPASVQQGLADTLTAIELPSADRVVEGTTGFLSSSLGVALANAAPYAAGALVLVIVVQVALARLREAATAALPPVAGVTALGLAAFAAVQSGAVELPNPAWVAAPVVAAGAGFVALSSLTGAAAPEDAQQLQQKLEDALPLKVESFEEEGAGSSSE